MRRIILMILFIILLAFPVEATEFTAPEAPDRAQELLPETSNGFAEDLLYVIKTAIGALQPDLMEAAATCLSIIAVIMLVSIIQNYSEHAKKVAIIVGAIGVSVLLLQSTHSLVRMASSTVIELSEYGKLLLPVMTAALAAQGGASTSVALYTGTAFFDAVLTTIIAKLIVPMIYIYICLCIANCALQEQTIRSLRGFAKWLTTWSMKTVLYIFTGYMGITGVVSGTTDAAAIKAAKLTISGAVPIVGNILSDASEAVLVSAGVMKSAAGVYGLITIIALFIGPFLKVGIQYLLLKVTAAICGIFGTKESTKLIEDFSSAMGFILAMNGSVCLMLLISTVCFMRGVT